MKITIQTGKKLYKSGLSRRQLEEIKERARHIQYKDGYSLDTDRDCQRIIDIVNYEIERMSEHQSKAFKVMLKKNPPKQG